MAAPTWRMNGVWRRMAGVLLLCVLLLSSEVMCQDDAAADATDVPAAADTADPSDTGDAAAPADAGDAANPTDAGDAANPTDAGDAADAGDAGDAGDTADNAVTDAAGSAAAPDTTVPSFDAEGGSFTIRSFDFSPDNQDGGTSGPSGITVAPVVRDEVAAPAEVPDGSHNVKLAVPEVMCVGESDISESSGIVVEVETADCEEAKRIILDNSADWCKKQQCTLRIFQDGKRLLIASDDIERSDLGEALLSSHLINKLTKSPSSSGSSVFVGILVSGLLAAVAITVGYFKCQRRATTKGVRLAEEAYPTGDQENQGNTLVSVAPLNPPPETQEKPSVNGESPEAAKTQPPPPTNGHSTTKTADTEM